MLKWNLFKKHYLFLRKLHLFLQEFIDSVMILLGIDHIQHSLVGDPKRRGISGGKKLKIHSNVLFLICRI